MENHTIVTLKKGEGRTIKAGGAWIFDNQPLKFNFGPYFLRDGTRLNMICVTKVSCQTMNFGVAAKNCLAF